MASPGPLASRAAPRRRTPGARPACLARLLPAVVTFGACRSAPVPAARDGAQPEIARSITMERLPCYGTCAVYAVTIRGDGEVHFLGIAHVARAGEAVARITPAGVDSLFRFLDHIGFDRLSASYTSGASACGAYVPDLPTVTVSVVRSGVATRVTHDYGCAAAPPVLGELHRRIDAAAGTQRWIGGF